jgi:predicted DNA-binding transcriptional regulator AlpA
MERLLTPAELGAILGLAEQSIYNRKCQALPLPPAVKLGRLLRFPESGVNAWIAALPSASAMPVPTTNTTSKRRPGRPTKTEQIARRNAPISG